MTHIKQKINTTVRYNTKQQGVVLIVCLIILFVVVIIGMQSMSSSISQDKMTANTQDRQKSFQAAETAGMIALSVLNANSDNVVKFVQNSSTPWAYDIRNTGAISSETNTKDKSHYKSHINISNWPWNDSTKRAEIDDYVKSGNPMSLALKPQYIIGMQAPQDRKGSEGYQCTPFSVISAGQGSYSTSQTLLEMRTVPKSGCFKMNVN